ncbi:MAG: hypothetical protein ACP5UQ_12670, partial [Anaerolineae bacterium]
MRRNFRLAGYLLAMAIMLGALAIGPGAWATPDQARDNQTVPTRTPKPPAPTVAPTAAPRPTSEPQPTTPPQPTATLPAAATPSPTPSPTAPAPVGLSLSLSAAPMQVWSGVTVVYTLTVTNLSAAAVRNIVLLDPLPAGLEPGAIMAGPGAVWEGTALRAVIAELTAGAQAVVIFTAKVGSGAPAGKVIVSQASATAGAT